MSSVENEKKWVDKIVAVEKKYHASEHEVFDFVSSANPSSGQALEHFIETIHNILAGCGYRLPRVAGGKSGLISLIDFSDGGQMPQLIALYDHFLDARSRSKSSLSQMEMMIPVQKPLLAGQETTLSGTRNTLGMPYTLSGFVEDFGADILEEIPFYKRLMQDEHDAFDIEGLTKNIGLSVEIAPQYEAMRARLEKMLGRSRGGNQIT